MSTQPVDGAPGGGFISKLTLQLQPLTSRWEALAGRERRLVALAVGVVLLFLVWILAVQPAWRTLRSAPAQMDALDAQWQGMQRLAADAQALRATPPVSAEQSNAALKAATDRLGEKGRLALQGERAVLTVNGASPAQLRDWLAEARSGARARPLEATLQRGPAGFSGTLAVAVGSAP